MIAVVGSGPVGNFTAYQLAKRGQEATVYEEHQKIGAPVQCTGIVTADIRRLIRVRPSTIVNRISRIRVIAPNNESFLLKLKKPELILDRTSFDSSIADLASEYDVRVRKGHRFVSRTGKEAIFSTEKGKKTVPFSHLVGADGPLSRVAKSATLLQNRTYYHAMQATVKGDFDKSMYQTFFGREYPGFFGWLVPENEGVARIGLGTRCNPQPYFKRFLERYIGADWEKRVVGYQNGLIPIHNPLQPIEKGNTCLVGDAAAQVKATTGGGIIPGMKAAIALSEALAEKKSYRRTLWQRAGKGLFIHLLLRKALDRFTDRDYNRLIEIGSRKNIRQILETTSREHPTGILMKALKKEPRLLLFAKILFQRRQKGER
ncbi:MAG: NAD(P)/FAD-dependent oxidoreductase [DPANN group archaeon]|nr:NAD(P)/FAD-dependent oxidoreductase [DPANN group archaeon]